MWISNWNNSILFKSIISREIFWVAPLRPSLDFQVPGFHPWSPFQSRPLSPFIRSPPLASLHTQTYTVIRILLYTSSIGRGGGGNKTSDVDRIALCRRVTNNQQQQQQQKKRVLSLIQHNSPEFYRDTWKQKTKKTIHDESTPLAPNFVP